MNILAAASVLSNIYSAMQSGSSTNQASAGSAGAAAVKAKGDAVELSAAAKSGANTCIKGNSSCTGCGACMQTSSKELGGQFAAANYLVQAAMKAYNG